MREFSTRRESSPETTLTDDFGLTQRPLRLAPDMTVGALVDELTHSSFGARTVAHACRLAERWSALPDLRVILTISGALSIAQQSSIVAQLIAAGRIHAIVATGAVVTHSLTQEAGGHQRPVLPGESDETLAESGLNRVFDTVESDSNLARLGDLVRGLEERGLEGPVGSAEIVRGLGLSDKLSHPGMVSAAAEAVVPIFVPALSDSELGLRLAQQAPSGWTYDAFEDLTQFKEWIRSQPRCGILSLGGGVPRNWAQQMFAEVSGHDKGAISKLVSGIRVCPDSVALGHLSGSTYSEARSWRKISSYDERLFVEVSSDFTIVFPLIAIAMLKGTTESGTGHRPA